MRGEPGDLVDRHVGSAQRVRRRVHHDAHGPAVDLGAVHLEVVVAVRDRLGGRRQPAPARRDPEQARGRAVDAEVERQQAEPGFVGARAQHECGRAIAEEDAGAAVVGIDEAGQRLGADHEHVVEVAGGQHRRADDQLVDEARAPGVEVERSARDAEAVVHERAGVGDELLGAGRRDDEEVDVAGREARRA